jgi:hypothetical protein
MFLRANSLETVEEVFYYYCDTAGSNTKTMDLERYYDSVFRAIKYTYESCHNMPPYENCKEAIEYMLVNIYSYGINRCLYDHIARLGANTRNVHKYFDRITPRERELIEELCRLKKRIISIDYDENQIIKKRISNLDIEIMKECDSRF